MTTLGHALTGLSVGVLCMPRRWSLPAKAVLLGSFAVLANVPDIRYAAAYRVRHSLFVNLGLMALPAAAFAAKGWRRRLGGWPVLLGGAAAWLSHLLLDSFYSHGGGLNVGWPVAEVNINLSMPWFDTLKYGLEPTARTARVLGTEALFYGAVLAVCLAARRVILARRRRRPAPETCEATCRKA